MTVINWAEVLENAKSASFSVIPKNEYHVKLEEVNATTASTGKPMLKFRCRVQSGPHARASLLTQQVLTLDNPNALNIFIKFLGAFGIGADYLGQLGTTADLSPIAQVLEGREAIAVVEIEKWQDEDRNQVKRFKPLSGGLTGGAPVGMPGVPAPMGGIPTPGTFPTPGGVPVPQPIPMPGVPTPGAQQPQYGTPPPPPAMPAPPSPVQDAPAAATPPAPPAPPMPSAAPQAPAQPPVAPPAPVGPPPAPQPPQAAPPAAPQPSAAPATPPAPPAFDFSSLPPEVQQQIMASYAQPPAAQPEAPAATTPTGPAVITPPLPPSPY